MKTNRKKGQTEDIFADLVIALILIVATIAIIATKEYFQGNSVPVKTQKDVTGLYGTDIVTLMRTPVPEFYLRDTIWRESEVKFGEMLAIIGEGNKEKYPWVFSKQIAGFSPNYGFVVQEGGKCTASFEEALGIYMRFLWQVALYNDKGEQVFWCSPKGVKFTNERDPYCQLIRTKLPTETGNTITAEIGVCP
ncbi:MAG TPA: hypothetical protein HA362_02265 [Nanoarchaeota archaeon]|nr:hypothetical protein [Nanoarchaeota archaeon]